MQRSTRIQPSQERQKPRLLLAVFVGVLLFCVLITQRAAIREHQLYFTEPRRSVAFELSDLTEEWSEATLRERFPDIPPNCEGISEPGLGDVVCVLDTKSFNGVPALFISFFFASGRLQQVSINVPWWRHQAARDYLDTSLGEPSASQIFPHSGVRLHGWRLSNGAAVFYNRDMSINPLEWNAIYWQSASLCERAGCFTARRARS
ncbi:hypothetical protein [Niveibacterium sp.]|uniref:hypothetical protein n=1 Tax=Niveibacterium sp. TaxID=2017444 RepID=UPI0035ADEDB2